MHCAEGVAHAGAQTGRFVNGTSIMAETTRKIGSGQTFTSHQGAYDQLVVDVGGNMGSQDVQHMHTEPGGTNNVFNEAVDGKSGLIGLGPNDYISWENQNSFIRNGIATAEHGTVIQTSSSVTFQFASYTRIDGYDLRCFRNDWSVCAYIAGGAENIILKNCFLFATTTTENNYASAIHATNGGTCVLSNVCINGVISRKESHGIYWYSTSGTNTLKIFHSAIVNIWGELAGTAGVLSKASGGNVAVVDSYNVLCDAPYYNGACWKVYGNGGTETITNQNCVSGDASASAFAGSGNLINKLIWKDCYFTDKTPFIWDLASVLRQAGCDLSSNPYKEHFLNDIHNDPRVLTGPDIGPGNYKLVGTPTIERKGTPTLQPKRIAGRIQPRG